MSKNYTNYSKIAEKETPEVVDEAKSTDEFSEACAENGYEPEEVATVTATGTVTGCEKLNVRKAPSMNGEVVCVIAKDSVVVIDETDSTDEWFKVFAENGAEGFCMKKFINAESL